MSKKQKGNPAQETTEQEVTPVEQAPETQEVQVEAAEIQQASEPVVETPEPAAEPVVAPVVEEPVAEAPKETAAPAAQPKDLGTQDQSTQLAAPVQPAAPAKTAPKAEVKKDDTVAEGEAYLDNIRVKGTEVQKRMLAAVETFAERLRPKMEVDAIKGVEYQVEFLDHMLWVLGKEDYEEFRKGWNVLLVYFHLYHGVNTASNYTALSEFSTTRFMHAWTKGELKANAYRNLITLLRATRDPETRKHSIMTIDLAKVGAELFGETELNNLKRFYGV